MTAEEKLLEKLLQIIEKGMEHLSEEEKEQKWRDLEAYVKEHQNDSGTRRK